jgi:signal transduction histidine kinase/HAMP domain-containing protein
MTDEDPRPAGDAAPAGLYGRLRPGVTSDPPGGKPGTARAGPTGGGSPSGGLSLRARVTAAALVAAVAPLLLFAGLLGAYGELGRDPTIGQLLILGLAFAIVLAIGSALYIVRAVTLPLRRITSAVESASRGESAPLAVAGEDELGRLAETQNRLAADVERRNRQLERIREAAGAATPSAGPAALLEAARAGVVAAFDLIDARVARVDPRTVRPAERVPGEPIEIRAELRAGEDRLGIIVGRLPATRSWDRADQDLLELYGVVVGAALRNADLFARVQLQNRALVAADEAKDDFFRGVSHNLQTPLARIRGYAERIAADTGDRRAQVIAEQSERLSRMVRQLLTVTRVDAGTIRPRTEVLALGPRVRRTWEALAAEDVALEMRDDAASWLAIADGDQVDQVLWALLDNAVRYGGRQPIEVTIRPDEDEGALLLTVTDHGPGVDAADRDRLFGRFERGGSLAGAAAGGGSGLGLYVSRALCRAMGGELDLAPDQPGRGACFVVTLPAEQAEEI